MTKFRGVPYSTQRITNEILFCCKRLMSYYPCPMLLGIGVKVDQESDVKGVYSSSDDRTRLTYRCTKHAAYIGSKVGGSS